MHAHVLKSLVLLGFVVLAMMTGCESRSVWERSYVGATEAAPLPPLAEVQVRQVNWDRVQATLKEMESDAAASDVHPDDWTEAQKAVARAKLLRGLQVSEDPAVITILGRSDFRTTSFRRPEGADEAELKDFARKIGANRVSWTRSYLGKAETIVQEPVSTWTQGTDWGGWDRKRSRRTTRMYSESSTTWVPVRVQSDEYAYLAYFLRDPAP